MTSVKRIQYGDFGPMSLKEESEHFADVTACCPRCLLPFADLDSYYHHPSSCADGFLPHTIYCDTQASIEVTKLSIHDDPPFVQRLHSLACAVTDFKNAEAMLENYDFYVCRVGTARLIKLLLVEISSVSTAKRTKTIVGFFSRDRTSASHNLSVISVFSPFQRLGIGQFLVALSYAISKGSVNTQRRLHCMWGADIQYPGPEYPLSPAGAALYAKFWDFQVCSALLGNFGSNEESLSIRTVSAETGIDYLAVVATLNRLAAASGLDSAWISTMRVDRNAEIVCDAEIFALQDCGKGFCTVSYAKQVVERGKPRYFEFQESNLELK